MNICDNVAVENDMEALCGDRLLVERVRELNQLCIPNAALPAAAMADVQEPSAAGGCDHIACHVDSAFRWIAQVKASLTGR